MVRADEKSKLTGPKLFDNFLVVFIQFFIMLNLFLNWKYLSIFLSFFNKSYPEISCKIKPKENNKIFSKST